MTAPAARSVPHVISAALDGLGVSTTDTIVVACSGGCDSVAVAAALREAGRHRICLGWINHNIRDSRSLEGEARVVRSLARRLNVSLYERTVPRGVIVREVEDEKRSVEEVARSHRYRLLASIAREVALTTSTRAVVVTAHHRDDGAETTLMRLVAGHSLLESVTIPPSRRLDALDPEIMVYRPALSVGRDDLRCYAAERSLEWVHDDSNDDPRFLRNRVRNRVLPVVDEHLPGASYRLSAVGRHAARIREALWALIPESAQGVHDGPDRWRIEAKALLDLPEAARELVLREAVYRISRRERAPGGFIREALRRLREETTRRTSAESETISGADVDIVVESAAIIVRRRVVPTGQSGYLWLVKGPVYLRFASGGPWPSVDTGENESRQRDANGNWYGPLHPPTVIRSRRSGDAILFDARRRELSGVLKRAGVPARRRESVAVMEDTSGIAAIFDVDGVRVTRDGVSVARERHAEEGWVYVGVVN